MATGNKLVKEITDQFLHCKICYEPYKEPKTLTCLHTFCTDCIQKHVDSDASGRSSRFLLYNRNITCPLCRSKTEIPTGGVRKLPDNFLLSSLTDALDRKRIGKNPPCEICPGDGRQRASHAATHKCLDCTKLLCKSCVDLHVTTKVTQNHSLIDIEGEKDIECKKHPEEIVRYYCEPCEECVCVVCTFQEHRDHEICSFTDGFSKYKSGLDDLLGNCKQRLSEVQTRISTINKVEGSLKETRENIRDLAISYIQQVRTTERQLIAKVEDEFGSKVQNFLQNKEWLQENMDGLKTACDLAEIIMNDRGIEMLLLKKELQSKLSTLLEPALPPVPDDLSHNIKFIPGNVQLGDISMDGDDDDVINEADLDGGSVKRCFKSDEVPPTKRQCVSRDTQTDMEPILSPVKKDMINFETPTTHFSKGKISDSLDKGIDDLISKADVSVNTMCSMSDSKLNLAGEDEPTSPSVCVKCCAELKKDCFSSSGSLPVVDGTPPTILDINITNYENGDKREGQRRRRSLIKSRRVQTDLSQSNESLDELLSPLRRGSQERLSTAVNKSSLGLFTVAESLTTRTVGLDPIDFGFSFEKEKPKPFTRSKGVNTTENVKVVCDTRSVRTNTVGPTVKDSSTITHPSQRTMDTQTPTKNTANKFIATDYTGQQNKRTSTPAIITIDNSTCMPTITQESKVTWTDALQTTERSVCTDVTGTSDSGTDPVMPSMCDQSVGIRPDMITVETNTDPIPMDAANGVSGAREKERKTKTKEKERDKDKEKKEKTTDKKKVKEKKEKREKKKCVSASTETDPVIKTNKETSTVITHQKDSWTETLRPQLINTGISPARPATREASVTTNPVTMMDQATYTTVVNLQDSTTETIITVCDGETLTEQIGQHDAQTYVDITTETVATLTDMCPLTDTACGTDINMLDDLDPELLNVVVCDVCQERRSFVDAATSPVLVNENKNLIDSDTQTAPIRKCDKLIATSSFDFEDAETSGIKAIECNDMATSTENLPYIGFMSEMDCDEMILLPSCALDMMGEECAYEKIISIPMADASAQTIVSSATLDIDLMIAAESEYGPDINIPKMDNLITVGVNTEQKQTFEKETSTMLHHYFSKATNTQMYEKVDKSTSTDSFVRTIQESFGQSPASDRILPKYKRKDVSVETDSTLMDEKMMACINKLKTVSERLNSPTNKSPPETAPWNKQGDAPEQINSEKLIQELDKVSEKERKQNVMALVAKSQAMTKGQSQKESCKTEPVRRKAQPLTTLKGRYALEKEDVVKPEQAKQTNSQPAQSPAATPCTKRAAVSKRNSSAPGRIATVPSQAAVRKAASPKVSPKSVTNKQNGTKTDRPKTPTSTKVDSPPAEFYSTVPKTRHQRNGLPSISETRPCSTGSEMSNASFRSAASEQPKSSNSSLDSSLDFSSLKITVPPRQPSVSPTPARHAVKKDSRVTRPEKKKTTDVIPAIDITPDPRVRTGSTSSEQTDTEPTQEKKGFMKKLFGSKKKKGEKRTSSPSKSPRPGRKALTETPQAPQASQSPQAPSDETKDKGKEKAKPFVYMRSRIFSIEQKDDGKYNKPTVNKYCVNEDKPPVFDFAATFSKKK